MAISETLKAIFGKVSEVDASETIYSRAKHYPNFTSVYIPNSPYQKLKKGYEAIGKTPKKQSKAKSKQEYEDNLERSIRRTKLNIRDYTFCSQFDLFCTFTFKTDRHDMDKCRAKMSNWLKNQQKRNGKFEYLIVPELHKDGALHFHGLLKGYTGKLTESGHKTKYQQPIYNIKSFRSGFTTAWKIPPEDIERVGNYVRKYSTKDMPLFSNKNRYWPSSGLKLPVVEQNPTWLKNEKPIHKIILDYGILLFFPARSGREA
jgi:hypothetical protein